MSTPTTMSDVADAQPPIGPRIRVARENAGLSVEELARRVGVDPSSVTAWEAGEREPRANRLQMLSGVLDVNFAWLLLGREDRYMADGEVSVESLKHRVERARQLLAEALAVLEDTHSALDEMQHGASADDAQ